MTKKTEAKILSLLRSNLIDLNAVDLDYKTFEDERGNVIYVYPKPVKNRSRLDLFGWNLEGLRITFKASEIIFDPSRNEKVCVFMGGTFENKPLDLYLWGRNPL